jgi:chromate transporter
VSKPSLRTLAALYFRIGNQTFGSGSTTVVLLTGAMTERGWLQRFQCDSFFALARVVPGTNVLAFASATAHAVRGWPGAITAILAYTVPASAVVIVLTLAYQRWNGHPVGGGAITAAMSSIVGIISGGAWLLAAPHLRSQERLRAAALVLGAVVLSLWLAPLTIMAIGAAVGFFWPERE